MAGAEYYDAEAGVYDESRGGIDRARSAATAVLELVPARGRCLDLGGGTGIVTAELAGAGLDAIAVDTSVGMLELASGRLPGRVVAADAMRLPVGDDAVDVVTAVWLLHLLEADVVDGVLAEAARVVRPGGHVVITVDKEAAHGRTGAGTDARGHVTEVFASHGLHPIGSSTFTGRSRWGSATDGDPEFTVIGFQLEESA